MKNIYSILKRSLGAGTYACMFFSCSGELGAFDATEQLEESLFAESRSIKFPDVGQSTTVVNLCWETATGNEAQRLKIREGAELWSAATNNWVTFTGWDTVCDSDHPALKMRFRDSCGTTGVVTFGSDMSDTHAKYCGLHEIGHVLGLQHEHLRFDGTTCQTSEGGAPGDLLLGLPDVNSAMGYCSGWAQTLSTGDVDGAKRLFGDGSHVVHGKDYALRLQTGTFVFLYDHDKHGSNRAVNTATGERNLLRVLRESGSGAVRYGDRIALQQAPYKSCTTEFGASGCPSSAGSGYVCPVNGETGEGPNPCYWTIQRTTDGGGGSYVDVNDPFVLKSGNVYLSHAGEKDGRFTGDFEGTEAKLFSGTFWLDRQGLPIRADAETVGALCREKGYIAGTLATPAATAFPPGVTMPSQMYTWTQNGQRWDSGTWAVVPKVGDIARDVWCRR